MANVIEALAVDSDVVLGDSLYVVALGAAAGLLPLTAANRSEIAARRPVAADMRGSIVRSVEVASCVLSVTTLSGMRDERVVSRSDSE